MAKKRNKYTEEFKRDAVRLLRNRGESTVAHVADDLGVPTNQLHRWASKLDRLDVAKRNDRGETVEEENRRLRKEVERGQQRVRSTNGVCLRMDGVVDKGDGQHFVAVFGHESSATTTMKPEGN